VERREIATHLVTMSGLPVLRACQAVALGRATYSRPRVEWVRRDAPVMAALTALVATKSRWGFWKCVDRLRLDGHGWNHKRLWRVYCQLRLNLPRRTKKRLPTRPVQPLTVSPQPHAVWALDFMSDTLYGGRRFRTFNILDEGVREVLAIEVDTSLPAERVIRVLDQLTAWRGIPQAIRLDNGPEFLADRFASWCAERGIALRYIQPGKPNQNAFIERFNRTFRHEVLDAYVFESLDQVREMSAQWIREYNEERPHEALARVPPATYRAQITVGSSPLTLSL
jgi:putative transposase